MTDALIEAVARAIKRDIDLPFSSPVESEIFESAARAALSAIEASGTHFVGSIMPTPEMVEAGHTAAVALLTNADENPPPAAVTWQAMANARPKVTP